MRRWLWLSLVVVLLDQATKLLVERLMALHETMALVPGLLNLTRMHNSGAAFSFLAGAGGWQRWFFISVALLVSAVIMIWLTRLRRNERWLAAALALVLGGALGNVWDRLAHGYVIDFIDLYYGQWHWPAFNVADSAITIGAAMILIDAVRGGGR